MIVLPAGASVLFVSASSGPSLRPRERRLRTYWAARLRGDAEAQYLAGRWLTLARYYAQVLAVLRHDRARRAITRGKPVQRVAGELAFIESYRVDMGRLESVLERELGGPPPDAARGA